MTENQKRPVGRPRKAVTQEHAAPARPAIAPLLLTTRETCEALAISRTTLGVLVTAGQIRPIRLGSEKARLRFRVADVQQLVANWQDGAEAREAAQ